MEVLAGLKETLKTAAMKVPILPHNSPEASQPRMKLPLHSHQLRALHRCLLIETDGSLSGDFGVSHDYKSRGGCLADAVGMGKTAVSIGLILAADKGNRGDTLVVAPGHLIQQWKHEIQKFSDDIEVLVGKQEYESRASSPTQNGRRVVLVDVDDILNENKLWYNFRRVFDSPGGSQRSFNRQTMETYKKAALFCVQSPRGPCSYDGWVYTGSLHLPFRPWRRVIFDEIQDLVSEGTESQKNLLQLSRTAQNVWLLSATPFPHGNQSVYANHELLGFCRLRMDVEVDKPLDRDHPFEIIKRKLYIRSPKNVVSKAVTAIQKVSRQTIIVDATALERKFFDLERNDIDILHRNRNFGEAYASLRQMMVHPEASKKLREQINGKKGQNNNNNVPERGVGRFASVNSFARSSLAQAKDRFQSLKDDSIPAAKLELVDTRTSWNLALKIRQVRKSPVQSNPFGNANTGTTQTLSEAGAIHKFYCRCPSYGSNDCKSDSKAQFRTMGSQNQQRRLIYGKFSTHFIIDYFNKDLESGKMMPIGAGSIEAIELYITSVEKGHKMRLTNLVNLETEKVALEKRIEALAATVVYGNSRNLCGEDDLAARHGSKSAALIRHLRKIHIDGERTIVFSFWHDTLSLVWRSLKKCNLKASFCNGSSLAMSQAISDFTSGKVSILLLSAQAKASGANLQCATNVVLLDPAGSSAEHGATLEQQAIGRAVRMGQEMSVKVTRFCMKDTIEETLFEQIDNATSRLEKRSDDNSYTCEDAHKILEERKIDTDNEKEDEVLVAESISVSERVSRVIASAKAKGEVIVLDDSDDEDVEKEQVKPQEAVIVNPQVTIYPSQLNVKTEIANEKNATFEPNAVLVPAPQGVFMKRTHTDMIDKRSNLEDAESPSNKRAKLSVDAQESRQNVNNASLPPINNLEDDRARLTMDAHTQITSSQLKANINANTLTVTSLINIIAEGNTAVSCDRTNLNLNLAENEKPADSEVYITPNQRKWLCSLEELKAHKLKTGIAHVPGAKKGLASWCLRQRTLYRQYLNGVKVSLNEERIKALNDIGFVWNPKYIGQYGETSGSPKTPLKPSTKAAQNDTGRVVSPPITEHEPLKDPPADDDLRDLLAKGHLQEYCGKLQESGISSLRDLCDKLEDALFMEKLVTDVGFTASQAVRFQMLAGSFAQANSNAFGPITPLALKFNNKS